jgi:hypothetical protein
MRRGALAAVAVVAAGVFALAPPVRAQVVSKNLTRTFDGNPYQDTFTFFTAAGSDAVLTFTRVIGDCPDSGLCTTAADCHGGACVAGQCIGPIDVYPTVGQVAVIRKSDYCTALACGSGGGAFVPPECLPAPACPTPCSNPASCDSCPQALGLCACQGANECPPADAPFSPLQVAFNETFESAVNANGWIFNRATVHPSMTDGFLELGSDPAVDPAGSMMVADATVRFPLVPGQDYVLFVKYSFSPLSSGLQCYPYGRMEVHFEGRPEPCDQDQDGYPVGQDCDDGNAAIHPGQPDATCDGVDDNCNGMVDENYVSEPDHWDPVAGTPAIGNRTNFTLETAPKVVVLWGGFLSRGLTSSGSLFSPSSLTWTPTSLIGAPAPRADHTAVQAGNFMIVWGGTTGTNIVTNTGAIFDPLANAWQIATSTAGAPVARSLHSAVWTGSKMIVWGGKTPSGTYLPTGGLYQFSNNTWGPTNTFHGPAGRSGHSAVWTGSKMIIWGGETAPGTVTNTGAVYDPAADTWSALTLTGAPSAREGQTAIWTGTEILIWGGRDALGGALGDGARLKADLTWSPLSAMGAPSPRSDHVAGWDGTQMLIWGGMGSSGTPLNDGARFNPASGVWSPMTLQNAPPADSGARAAMWSPLGQMLVWGVSDAGGLYLAGSSCGIGACARSAGTVCTNGAIQYLCTPGMPAAEVCDGADNDCNGLVDDGIPPVSGSPSLSVSAPMGVSLVSWTPVPNGQVGDLVRGRLSTLESSGGNYTLSTETCLLDNSSGRTYSEAGVPPLNDGFWYLSRDVNLCSGPGTYDEGSASQVGSRDAEIAASPGPCP